jgi:Protein of unknown function (DUF2721)
MPPPFQASDVLAAMITPAVLISASGTLVLSTSNRLTRVVDRVRALAVEAERLPLEAPDDEHRRFLSEQLTKLSARVLVLRTALTVLYSGVGFLVAASIAVGLSAAFGWSYGWVPVSLGLAGAGALFHSTLLLVREGRLALGSTLQELERARRSVERRPSS